MSKSATGRKTRQTRRSKNHGAGGIVLTFEKNDLLQELLGAHDQHLALIEDRLNVVAHPKGNKIALTGAAAACRSAKHVLEALYMRLEEGLDVGPGEVDGAVRLIQGFDASGTADMSPDLRIVTKRRVISPRSAGQAAYMAALKHHELVLATGPAGTGKTYLAVAAAAAALAAGEVDRIVLSRPAVEAGERLGFLPGDMRDKVDPYLRPLYDALYDVMPGNRVARGLEEGSIEIAPLAFMRGRTLVHSFIILDEGQNCTPVQMKMFLTRLGEGSRMVVTGDPSQTDLPERAMSGLNEAVDILRGCEGVALISFDEKDVVRHPLVSKIVNAYDKREQPGKNKARR